MHEAHLLHLLLLAHRLPVHPWDELRHLLKLHLLPLLTLHATRTLLTGLQLVLPHRIEWLHTIILSFAFAFLFAYFPATQ